MTNVTAVILCGGQGTRLKPVIGNLPKCLAPVAGRPFLEYLLEHLKSQGVRKVVLCLGVGSDQVTRGKWTLPVGMTINYSIEPSLLGTGGALKNALPLLDTDPVLVLNGDTFCKFDLNGILNCSGRPVTLYDWGLGLGVPSKAAGVWLMTKSLIEGELEALQRFLDNNGFVIPGVAHQQRNLQFLDIGTSEDYAKAEEFMRKEGAIK